VAKYHIDIETIPVGIAAKRRERINDSFLRFGALTPIQNHWLNKYWPLGDWLITQTSASLPIKASRYNYQMLERIAKRLDIAPATAADHINGEFRFYI